jgi:DNA-directed RNA polymerase specialized sigma24 family protein
MCGAVSDMEACIPALRRHASAMLRNPRDGDELVRACLSRALEQGRARGEPSETRTWLLAILHGELATRPWQARLRRANRAGRKPMQDPLRELDQLADQQRAVLLLVAIEDLSYADVAQILGITQDLVMSLLADGRERLRQPGMDAAEAGRRGR